MTSSILSRISVYDLCYMYIYYNTEREKDKVNDAIFKKKILAQVKIIINNGWCTEDIIRLMKTNSKNDKITNLKSLKSPGSRKRNLLQSDRLYLHNLLTISPNAPRLTINMESGGVKKNSPVFFREQVASISIEQLSKYYLEHNTLKSNLLDITCLDSSLKFILKKMKDIDLILFCIDIAEDMASTDSGIRITKPFDIMNYSKQASEDISSKKSLLMNKLRKKRNINKELTDEEKLRIEYKWGIVPRQRDKDYKWIIELIKQTENIQ